MARIRINPSAILRAIADYRMALAHDRGSRSPKWAHMVNAVGKGLGENAIDIEMGKNRVSPINLHNLANASLVGLGALALGETGYQLGRPLYYHILKNRNKNAIINLDPYLKENKREASNYYDTLYALAPSMMKDPNAAIPLLRRAVASQGIPMDMYTALAKHEQTMRSMHAPLISGARAATAIGIHYAGPTGR